MAEDKSEIAKLEENLYSQTRYEEPANVRKPLEPTTVEASDKWQSPELKAMLEEKRSLPEGHPYMRKIFTGSLIFFVLAVLVAGYVFMGGVNFISSKNVEINVVGPTTARAGEAFELGIAVRNRNNADLEVANLSIQYPEETRDPEDTAKELTYVREELGEIEAGKEIARTARAILFGAEGEVKEIKISVEYKVAGSGATFYKDRVYEIAIGEAPLTFNVESPRSINSGEDFATTITVTHNAAEPIRNVMVRAEYPYGFALAASEPTAAANDNIWSLGTLAPGEKKSVVIRGRILGEDADERTLRFYVGVADAGGTNPNFRTVVASALNTIAIERPSVSLNTMINGENLSLYTAPAGKAMSATVNIRNNLSEKLINPRLEVKVSGAALDKLSVMARDGGVYNREAGTITWQLKGMSGIQELLPGEAKQAVFDFASLMDLASGSSHEINLTATFIATPASVLGARPITVVDERSVRISAEASIVGEAFYSKGAFTNHGSLPPKVDEETTYTIVWSARNTGNNVAEARVTARLGPGVKWLGATGDEISYSVSNNMVTWDLGMLESGTGFSSAERQVSFQVAITPTVAQVGTVPILVNNILLAGRDASTGATINLPISTLTTRLTNDPRFVQGDEVVKK